MMDIQTWRRQALSVLLAALAVGATPVVIFIGAEAIRQPERGAMTPFLVALYLLLVILALARRLPHTVRLVGFLLIGYIVGLIAFLRGGLVGDARLYLLIVPLLALVLSGARLGIAAGLLSTAIHVVFIFLARAGWLARWVVVTENPMALPDWLSATTVFVMLLGGLLSLLGLFNRTLVRSLEDARKSAREATDAYQRLEEQTAERERYVRWLEVATRLAVKAGATLDPDQILQQTVEGLQEQLGLLRAAVYLAEPGEREKGAPTLTLRASAGSPPQGVSPTAMLAFQSGSIQAARADGGYELACPMWLGGQISGVLVVGARETLHTDRAEATVLALIADQLALALENARLFRQTRASLQELEALYRRYTTQTWEKFAREMPETVHLWTGAEQVPAGLWQSLFEQARSTGQAATGREDSRYLLAVPVKLGGVPIGVLGLHRELEAGAWREEEIAMAEAVAERLALAVENARLLEEAQRRAARERLVAELGSRIRASLDLDTVLKTTVRELGQVLRARWVAVEVTGPSEKPFQPPED